MLNSIEITQPKLNNQPSFKSRFRDSEVLQKYIQGANNFDLLDFYNTLELLKKDGKKDDYFIKESESEYLIPFSKHSEKRETPEISLYKLDSEDMQIKRIETFTLGKNNLLEVESRKVIAELTSILRRHSFFKKSTELRKSTLENLAKILK